MNYEPYNTIHHRITALHPQICHLSEVTRAHNHLPCFVCVACLIIKIASPRVIKVVPRRCTLQWPFQCGWVGSHEERRHRNQLLISYWYFNKLMWTNCLCTSHCMTLKPLWAIIKYKLALRAQKYWLIVKFHHGFVILCNPRYIINAYRTRWSGIPYVSKTTIVLLSTVRLCKQNHCIRLYMCVL